MSEPRNYALVEDGIVVNVIWLNPGNAFDFPDAVLCDGENVKICDLYVDGAFVHVEASDAGDPVEAEIQTEGDQPA